MWIFELFANTRSCQRRRAPTASGQILFIPSSEHCRLENINDECNFKFNKKNISRDNEGVKDKATQTSPETVLLYAEQLKIHFFKCEGTSRSTREPVRVPRYLADQMGLSVCKFCERV